MAELRLRLDGAAGIDARAVKEGLDNLLKLVGGIESADDSDVWIISDLALGSASCGLAPTPENTAIGDIKIRTVISGVTQLFDVPRIPAGWDESAIRALLSLTELGRLRGVEGVRIMSGETLNPIFLDERIRRNAEACLEVARQSLGSVRGQIVRYVNDKNRREISVRETASGRAVRVLFPRHLDSSILNALAVKGRISVSGMVRRNRQGQKVLVNAEKVTQLAEPATVADDVAGSLGADWTLGLNSVEWAREQRDE